jgi:hypothetical protein
MRKQSQDFDFALTSRSERLPILRSQEALTMKRNTRLIGILLAIALGIGIGAAQNNAAAALRR